MKLRGGANDFAHYTCDGLGVMSIPYDGSTVNMALNFAANGHWNADGNGKGRAQLLASPSMRPSLCVGWLAIVVLQRFKQMV